MWNALNLKRRSEILHRAAPEERSPRNDSGELTLADLEAGQSAQIACMECDQRAAGRCERLLAYGLVEGQTIMLVQKKPVYIIRVDETELALDEAVARCVRLHLTGTRGGDSR